MNQSILEAYKWGDRTGLPFEGGGLFPGPINEELLQHAAKSIQGSDESSIMDCFTAFTRACQYTDRDQFVWDWCHYHQQHHGTGYGKTYRDHFQLVKHIDRNPDQYPDLQSRIGKLREIAIDANSFGNGSLAIVYPAYCYAQSIGEQPVAFVRHLVSFTHALMRLAPVVLAYYPDHAKVLEYSRLSTLTTHAAEACINSSLQLANILMQVLSGFPKESILNICDDWQGIAKADASAVIGSGYAPESLKAAVWAFLTTNTFEDAILAAANLGDDADTTAAICGQIAGAYYTVHTIPSRWLEKLFMREEISSLAADLYKLHNRILRNLGHKLTNRV